jgi:hypothetical protein
MVDRADRRQRQHVGLEIGEVLAALPGEDVVGDAVGRRQRVAGNGAERGQLLLGGGALGGVIGVAVIIAEPVGVAIVAAEGGRDRIAPQIRFVAVVEELAQARVGAVRRGVGGRGRGRRLGRRSGRSEQQGKGEEGANGHDAVFRGWSRNCIAPL